MSEARTIILYHGNCPDGFGGAYAAWKKFGDSADYVALKHGKPAPADLAGARLYFIDFCYPQDTMDRIVDIATSVTVLDHHDGVRAIVESMPEHVYDAARSGATIAWTYFHPDEPVPELLSYVEDGDLYRFALPDARAVLAYIYSQPFTFASWDDLVRRFADTQERAAMIARGTCYSEHSAHVVDEIIARADLVEFEGHVCGFSEAPRVFASDVGNGLARAHPPIGIVAHARPDGMRISLRSVGDVDVAQIAQKYGGNGHPAAAAFALPWGAPLPWKELPKDE